MSITHARSNSSASRNSSICSAADRSPTETRKLHHPLGNMRVYRVSFDANNFQSLLFEDEGFWKEPNSALDGTPRLSNWQTPSVYCLKPKLRKGDFFGGHVGGLI